MSDNDTHLSAVTSRTPWKKASSSEPNLRYGQSTCGRFELG
jgi:hypothetical protein